MPSPWPRRLVIFGLIWGSLTLVAAAISEPTPKNLTDLFAIPSAGLYTLALYLARRFWLPWLSHRPVRVVSQVAGLVFGGSRLLDPGYWVLLAALAFWLFIPVYSSMVLPPAWVIGQLPPPPKPSIPAWRDALRPLLWLIPFAVYIIALLFLLAVAGG